MSSGGNLPFGFGAGDPANQRFGRSFEQDAAVRRAAETDVVDGRPGQLGPRPPDRDLDRRRRHRDPTAAESDQVTEALRLADLWLDDVTDLPSGVVTIEAWSRAQWIERTLPVWATLCDPIAARVVAAMGSVLPEEMKAQAGPIGAMMTQFGGMMFGAQVGQGIGALAQEIVSSTDVGLPLAATGVAALLPQNIAAFGEGLERPEDEVRLYLALREAAHQRLYGHVGWLRQRVIDTVEAYARGIKVDPSAIERAMSEVDPSNPESLQNALTGGMFEPDDTPEQVGGAAPARDPARARRGLGRCGRARGGRSPHAGSGRPARSLPAPPGNRRAGRADLLDPGRARAPAAAAARSRGTVVGRHRAPGRQWPRCDLGPPRPAADRRGSRRSPGLRRAPADDGDPLTRLGASSRARSFGLGELELRLRASVSMALCVALELAGISSGSASRPARSAAARRR